MIQFFSILLIKYWAWWGRVVGSRSLSCKAGAPATALRPSGCRAWASAEATQGLHTWFQRPHHLVCRLTPQDSFYDLPLFCCTAIALSQLWLSKVRAEQQGGRRDGDDIPEPHSSFKTLLRKTRYNGHPKHNGEEVRGNSQTGKAVLSDQTKWQHEITPAHRLTNNLP